MSKLWLVVKKEYLERVRTRSFAIGTVLGPILMAALMFGPALLAERQSPQAQTLAVVDLSGGAIYERIATQVEAMRQVQGEKALPLTVERYELPSGTGVDQARAELDVRVQEDQLDGYVVVEPDFLENREATYYGERVSGVVSVEILRSVLDQVVRQNQMEKLGIGAADLASVMRGADLELRAVGGDGEDSLQSRMLLGVGMIMLLYFMMVFYGQFTMLAVIEDKASRVVEVMLASITPTQLMMGKILGQGLVGFTQFGVWMIAGIVFSRFEGRIMGMELSLGGLPMDLWLYFGIFFVLGYLLYASLYAGVGALCSSNQEAQQFQGPITMLIVLPMVLLQVAIMNPDSGISMILSLIPVFTPILMFIRVVVGKPETWEILLSIALLVGTVALFLRGTGKLFRLSILNFGKAPNWAQVLKLLRSPD